MTDAQSALYKLIEAVEAGMVGVDECAAAFPSESAYGVCTWHHAWDALNGSLDAALALHKALLPGRTLSVGQNAHYGDWNAWVRYAEDGEILDEYTAASDTAASSLLLAILRAYRSTQP